jgi:methyl-accepting chemotaxis protein
MNAFLDSMSISKRLYISMVMSLAMLLVLGAGAWSAMGHTLTNSEQLQSTEASLVTPVADFQKAYTLTLQSMNDYLMTMNEQRGASFNTEVDALRVSLQSLLQSLGADVEMGGDGLLLMKNVGTQYAEQDIMDLFAIDNVLSNIKKSTNSSVFIRNNMLSTFTFGLESNAKRMLKDLQAMTASHALTPEQKEMSAEVEKRIGFSQIQAAKMITTLNVELIDDIRKRGIGDGADASIAALSAGLDEQIVKDMTQHRDDYLDALNDLRDFVKTIGQNNTSLSKLSNVGGEHIISLTTRLQKQRVDTLDMLSAEADKSRYMLLITILVAAIMGVIVTQLVIRSIRRPLAQMRQSLELVAQTGKLDSMALLSGNNELTDMQSSLLHMMSSVKTAIDEVRHVSHQLSVGNLSETMSGTYRGDLLDLSQAFNQSIINVRHTFDDLQQAAVALEKGMLDHHISVDDYKGQYRVVVQSIDEALSVQKNAIEDVRKVTRAMREGDFSQRIEMDMPGDLSNLKRYLNEALNRLEDAINQKGIALQHFSQGDFTYVMPGEYSGKLLDLKQNMGRMANSISSMLSEVYVATSHAVDGIKEISAGNQDLNRRVQQQATALAKTTQSMQMMSSAVTHTLDQSAEVARNTEQMRERSHMGRGLLDKLTAAMTEIQEASQKVSGMTDVINSISFQTNLLALNAAVEAARAGEHGRGFAVVAQEVRALAQKTSEASKDIHQVTQMNLSRIQEGARISKETSDAFAHNADAIDRIVGMTESMNEALNRQSVGIREVSKALEDIDATTQQNASMVEQIASTSDNIISEVLMLEEHMDQFNLIAQKPAANQPYEVIKLTVA